MERSRTILALIVAAAASSVGACQRQGDGQPEGGCYADHKQSHYVMLDNRADGERLIASLQDFAKAHGLNHESNRYPRGVPGNLRPQFLVSACNEHFYALGGNQEPAFISVKMLSDKLQHEAGTDSLAIELAARLKREFQDAWLGSDLPDSILERRNSAAPAPGRDRAAP